MNRITPIQTLAKGWQLIHDPDNRGRDENWFDGIPAQGAVPAEVPCFVHQYLPDCPGIAWYQLDFETGLLPDADHAVFLCFDMADFLCEVWLNGTRIGAHRGTENPFSFDVSGALRLQGPNRLAVRVSKPWTEPVDGYTFLEIPHRNQLSEGLQPGTCYNCYGLSGRVYLSLLPKVRTEDLFLIADPGKGAIEARCTVRNEYPEPVAAELSLFAADTRTGAVLADETVHARLQPGNNLIRHLLPVPEFCLWQPDDPHLYAVEAQVRAGSVCHRTAKRCGFRTFEVGEDGYFRLNGRRIFVRCSHTGNCMPESTWNISRDHALIRKDFVMAKAAGFNMVRFISGAALPEQLDLCDELGLMVYEEPVSGWLQGDGPRAEELYRYDLLTMIRRDRSHPCVTVWGLLNETVTDAPYGDVCRAARDSIPAVRELDETRLLLYNSGRFDHDPRVGSLCNPYHDRWECLWDGEDERLPGPQPVVEGDPGPTRRRLGDKHFYPHQPHSSSDIAFFRALGSDSRRPFFLSEYGVGSLFDVIWLSRVFEQKGSDPRWPDVAMVRHMADALLADLKRYGFDREFAFPADLMKESHRLHNRHRQLGFDIFRSNPYLNGMSLTGLLDHSVCGEGLWTLMREWKQGIADTLQEGFAPLRWCLFVSDAHLYAGVPFTVEGVLANEDVLQEKPYPYGIRITGRDGIVWEEESVFTPTAEALKGMAVPVFRRTLSLNLPEGEYTLCAELLEGAAAAGGRVRFHVSEDGNTRAELPRAAAIRIGPEAEALLRRKGVTPAAPEDAGSAAPVIVGDVPEEEKPAVWARIGTLLEEGRSVVLTSRFAAAKDGDMTGWLPTECGLSGFPAGRNPTDWLYHKEYLARRGHPYFSGLPTGMMDWEYYRHLICGAFFRADAPDGPWEAASIAVGVGEHCEGGYKGGMTLCALPVGKGRLILNAYRLQENLNRNPAADRLFLNILNTEYKRQSQ